jgi:CBS domain-containing protein
MKWMKGKAWGVDELIQKELLKHAREGLKAQKIDSADIDVYLGILSDRVASLRTGSQWALDSLAAMGEQGRAVDRYRALTSTMATNQEKGEPVHTWELAHLPDKHEHRDSFRTVAQIMTTDLFTVHSDDIVDLAASLMEWEHLRHVPVEDHHGHLVGLVTHRSLMRNLSHGKSGNAQPLTVGEVMEKQPVTCGPEMSSIEAIALMRKHKISCLPVVRDTKLVGIITEHDFFALSATLLERWLKGE